MRHNRIIFIVCLVFAILTAGIQPTPTPAQTTSPDNQTSASSLQISGHVLDLRGIPIPRAKIYVSPAVTGNPFSSDISGHYSVPVPASGTYLLHADHYPGYGTGIGSQLQVGNSNLTFNLTVPSFDDIIQNGGFDKSDTSLLSWTADGATIAPVSESHSGSHAVELRANCGESCPAEPEIIYPAGPHDDPSIAVDRRGNIHMVSDMALYSVRDAQGNWTTQVPIPTIDRFSIEYLFYPLAVDAQDTLHMVVSLIDRVNYQTTGLYYLQKPADGSWSALYRLTYHSSNSNSIGLDSQGNLYVIYTDNDDGNVYYLRRAAGGAWQGPTLLGKGAPRTRTYLAIGPDDSVHFLFKNSLNYPSTFDNRLIYRARLANGTLTAAETLQNSVYLYGGVGDIAVDANGTIHVVGASTSTENTFRVYLSKPAGGSWSAPQFLPAVLNGFDMSADSHGNLHIIGQPVSDVANLVDYYKAAGQQNFQPFSIPIDGSPAYSLQTAMDARNCPHIIWRTQFNLYYAVVQRDASITQLVTIEPGMYKRTLSFWTRSDSNLQGSGSYLQVIATKDGKSDTLLTIQDSAGWTHHWVDMDAYGDRWVNQDVTLTFQFHQGAGEPVRSVLLDEISLGSWMTPVIQNVSQAAPKSRDLIITGSNFLDPPSVYLGDTFLYGVVRVDETKLLVTVPPSFPSGMYKLRVVNPGHQESGISISLDFPPPPAINQISQAENNQRAITISGNNFTATPTAFIGEIALESIQWIDPHTLRATVPSSVSSGTYTIRVVNPDGQEASVSHQFVFDQAPAPSITSIAQSETNLRIITILGNNFLSTPDVYLGQAALLNIVFVDEHTLTAAVPVDVVSGTYSVRVVNPGGGDAAFSYSFVFEQPVIPTITGITQSESNPRSITITGSHFAATPTAAIGDAPLENVTFINEQQLQATVPGSVPSGTYTVRVVNPNGTEGSLSHEFKFGPPPEIMLVLPSEDDSRLILILGSNFSSDIQVYVDDTALEDFLLIDDQTLLAIIPDSIQAGTYVLRVVCRGEESRLSYQFIPHLKLFLPMLVRGGD